MVTITFDNGVVMKLPLRQAVKFLMALARDGWVIADPRGRDA